MPHLCKGGLGLPDRDYYFDADKADKRHAYAKHVARTLRKLDPTAAAAAGAGAAGAAGDAAAAAARPPAPPDAWDDAAAAVVALEASLAAHHLTKTERRDAELR